MSPILRIIIVLALGIAIVWAIATPFNTLLRKHDSTDLYRLAEIYEHNTAYDMLFIGSSRTHRSINPAIIDSICGVNSYNAGVEAGMLHDFKMTLEGYLFCHPAPKVLVLTIDLPSFSKTTEIQKYPQYYSFLNNKPVQNTLLESGYGLYLIKLFPFLSITDQDDFTKEMIIQMLRGRDSTSHPSDEIDYKGYASNGDAYIVKPQLEKVVKHMNITGVAVSDLNEIVEVCKKRKIKLIFTYAPEYDFYLQRTRTNKDSVFGVIYEIAEANKIPVLRDDSLSMCQSSRYFANNGHLNTKGATVYSAILAGELKKILAQDIKTR